MYRAKNIIDDDILFVLDNLREEDKIECVVSRGENFTNEILNDLKNLSPSDSFLLAKTKKDNIPVLIAGVKHIEKSIGCVFLLSTPEIEKHQICFLKEMKKQIEKYDENFSILYNQIYKTNHLAKNWLKWVGFRFPLEEKKTNHLDKLFLKIKTPENFEIFYRERPLKGLGE